MAQSLSRRALWIQKLSDEVIRGITEQIGAGRLAPGTVLPGREALVAEFVTSVGVIDRALERLTATGLVNRDEDGAFRVAVDQPGPQGFEVPQPESGQVADVIAILEIRMGVEDVSAALAAERHDAAQLVAIRDAQAAFEAAAAERSGPARADFRFHRSIGAASGNPYLLDLLEYLGPLLIPRMRVALPTSDNAVDENLQKSVAEHRAIVEAIAARDAEAARDAMRRHLTRTIDLVRSMDGGV